MIKSSYTKNYIKIYIWQGISLVLNFFSMFIVIPYLTSQPSVYGIYTICISFSIFLSYADLGFLSSGQKYAAEYYAMGKKDEELKVLGFTGYILLFLLLLFIIVFLFFSFRPGLLIKNLDSENDILIASHLLLILALFTPVTLVQRLSQVIYGVRLEDFIIQRINVVSSLIKVLSVLWFFRENQYNIVGYYLFSQIINLIGGGIIFFLALNRYKLNLIVFLKSFRFNKEVFLKSKSLAFTSLFLSVTWILYYELDPSIIGKLIGAKQVAIYGIGLTVLSFFRSILGVLFSPFSSRFNHFIGSNDIDSLKSFYLHIVSILAALVIIPILTVTFFARPLVINWVGVEYADSIKIVAYLVLCNIFAFINYPTSSLLMAKERISEMYLINTLIPLVYWGGICLMYPIMGLKSFAIFKLVAFTVSAVFYYMIMIKFLDLKAIKLFNEIFKPILLPIIFITISSLTIRNFLPIAKSKINLLITAGTIGLIIGLSFLIVYFSSTRISSYVKEIRNKY